MGTVTQQQVLSITQPLIGGITISGGLALAIQLAATNGGAVHNLQDISTLFQDSAGTTPVTSDGDPVGLVVDSSGNGLDASQATAGSRPTYRVDARGFVYLEFDGTDDYLTIPGSDSALKFMHDGAGGNAVFSARINDANPDSFQAVMGNSRFVTDIGFFITHDDRSGSGFEDRLYYLVSNGSANIIIERSSDNAFPAQTTSVIRYHLDSSLNPDITGYVDNSQVLSANASGAFSSSNSTADITIGARNSASGVADFCNCNWYGGLFTPTLTDQQAFELTRYYAQISGATL